MVTAATQRLCGGGRQGPSIRCGHVGCQPGGQDHGGPGPDPSSQAAVLIRVTVLVLSVACGRSSPGVGPVAWSGLVPGSGSAVPVPCRRLMAATACCWLSREPASVILLNRFGSCAWRIWLIRSASFCRSIGHARSPTRCCRPWAAPATDQGRGWVHTLSDLGEVFTFSADLRGWGGALRAAHGLGERCPRYLEAVIPVPAAAGPGPCGGLACDSSGGRLRRRRRRVLRDGRAVRAGGGRCRPRPGSRGAGRC